MNKTALLLLSATLLAGCPRPLPPGTYTPAPQEQAPDEEAAVAPEVAPAPAAEYAATPALEHDDRLEIASEIRDASELMARAKLRKMPMEHLVNMRQQVQMAQYWLSLEYEGQPQGSHQMIADQIERAAVAIYQTPNLEQYAVNDLVNARDWLFQAATTVREFR